MQNSKVVYWLFVMAAESEFRAPSDSFRGCMSKTLVPVEPSALANIVQL